MSFYSEPGRARKQCPKCKIYAHVRVIVCQCGHQLKEGELVRTTPPRSKRPGKGKKHCPNCNLYSGARTKRCECGYSFTISESLPSCGPTDKYDESEEIIHARYLFTEAVGVRGIPIITPSGICPVQLHSVEHDAVFEWCEAVLSHSPQNKCYAPSALKYFVRQFFAFGSSEYGIVCRVIDDFARTQLERLNVSASPFQFDSTRDGSSGVDQCTVSYG